MINIVRNKVFFSYIKGGLRQIKKAGLVGKITIEGAKDG